MKQTIKKFFKKLWSGAIIWLWFILSIWIFFIVYAAGRSVMTPVTSGSWLSANAWNQMIDNLNTLKTTSDWLQTTTTTLSWDITTINSKINNFNISWTKVTIPGNPHLTCRLTNTLNASIANACSIVTSRWWLAWSWDRINIPIAWVYLITFNAISSLSSIRVDSAILVNWLGIASALSENTTTWYHQKTLSLAIFLNVWDYVQFSNNDWHDSVSTSVRKTASVTLLN